MIERRKAADHAGRLEDIERWRILIDSQIGRFVSDAESEKGTRARVSAGIAESFEKLNLRIASIERVVWASASVLALLQIIMIAVLLKK